MRILMIYPEFPDTFWSFKHALPFIRKRASSPPLGLVTVAALLPQEWEMRLVDMNVAPLRQRDLQWADYAFVSAMVAQRDSTHEAITRCKAAGLAVVAGGPLFLGEHEDFPDVDHFVLNEGELTIPPFVRDLQAGTAKRIYETTEFADMRSSPVPRWDLLDIKYYSTMSIQYSRGCPFDCEFCNITAMLGRRPRTKSGEQIVAELDSLYKTGWRGGVFFVDDNFIGKRKELKQEILPAIMEWKKDRPPIRFQTEVSIDLADDAELMEMMTATGFDTVFVGIETPEELGLAECNKVQNEGRDLVESVKVMQRAGLQVQGGFIVGFDSDTTSTFQRQIDFIQRSGIVTAMVGLLQAPFGTRLYERMKNEGRLIEEFTGDNTDGSSNIVSKMDRQVLQDGYKQVISNIYSPKAYYKRVRTFLREYSRPRGARAPLTWNYLAAFFKSIYVLGIKERERFEYWKMVFWTIFKRPRFFADAITFSIYGYHFRRVWERTNS